MNGTPPSLGANFSSYSAAILDEVVDNFGKFARHVADNIATDIDRHSVPIVSVEFFFLPFELIAYGGRPVILIHMIASNYTFNGQHSDENPH